MRQSRQFFQACPVKARSGVLFSAWCNVFVSSHMRNGIDESQVLTKSCQTLVLGIFEEVAFESFELYADRVIIAVGSPSVLGLPCVPGAVIAADKLPKGAISANVKVRGDFQPPYGLKVGVRIPIELVGEQALHTVAAILTRWEADRVDHDQVNANLCRSGSEIGRFQSLSLVMPAVLPKRGLRLFGCRQEHGRSCVSPGCDLARLHDALCCSKCLFVQ